MEYVILCGLDELVLCGRGRYCPRKGYFALFTRERKEKGLFSDLLNVKKTKKTKNSAVASVVSTVLDPDLRHRRRFPPERVRNSVRRAPFLRLRYRLRLGHWVGGASRPLGPPLGSRGDERSVLCFLEGVKGTRCAPNPTQLVQIFRLLCSLEEVKGA